MDRIEKLVKFLNENPNDSFLKHALALEYAKAGNDAQAEEAFKEILKDREDYVGSYYHLGKLYERRGEEQRAIDIYAKGMEMAKAAGDNHSFNELRSAWEDMTGM